jgi:dephospho-CoA kinase
MIKVGLTGGIGSGKSTVARLFSLLGVPVFDSDSEAKKLYLSDSILKAGLIDKFGAEVYLPTGQINKDFLVSNIFSNKQMLNELNALVHPRVKICFDTWVGFNSTAPILIKEAAILFESGADRQLEKKIVVVAPVELRILRVVARDKINEAKVLERMKNQWPQEELIKRSDFIVDNSGKISVIQQVLTIYKTLMEKMNPDRSN